MAQAQFRKSYERGTRMESITGATAVTGAANNLNAGNNGVSNIEFPPDRSFARVVSIISADVVISGGTVTALTVLVEGSLDGVNWVTLLTFNGTTNPQLNWAVQKPVIMVRANVTLLTVATGTPAISVGIVGAA